MYEKHVGPNTYYGPNGPDGDGFGHGHISHATGYHRPPVSNSSLQSAAAWTAIMGAAGDGDLRYGKAHINIGNPAADLRG